MKRPQANDKITLKMNDSIYEETCVEAFPDKTQGPKGWKFVILSATDYNPDPLLKSQIWLMGKDNEERGASMVSVATASIKSDKKKITFVTLIGDAE